MEYKITDIVSDVRVCLDENDAQSTLLETAEYTLSLDAIIESKIVDALEGILLNAPLDRLGNGESPDAEESEEEWSNESDDGTLAWCRVERPSDYLRLLSVCCEDWDYPVTETITEQDDVYKQQQSRIAALRGNPQRPVVAEVKRGNRNKFEVYSSTTRAVTIRYIKRAESYIDKSARTVELVDSALYRPLVYQVAGLTCIALKDAEHAQTLFGLAQGMLDGFSVKQSE